MAWRRRCPFLQLPVSQAGRSIDALLFDEASEHFALRCGSRSLAITFSEKGRGRAWCARPERATTREGAGARSCARARRDGSNRTATGRHRHQLDGDAGTGPAAVVGSSSRAAARRVSSLVLLAPPRCRLASLPPRAAAAPPCSPRRLRRSSHPATAPRCWYLVAGPRHRRCSLQAPPPPPSPPPPVGKRQDQHRRLRSAFLLGPRPPPAPPAIFSAAAFRLLLLQSQFQLHNFDHLPRRRNVAGAHILRWSDPGDHEPLPQQQRHQHASGWRRKPASQTHSRRQWSRRGFASRPADHGCNVLRPCSAAHPAVEQPVQAPVGRPVLVRGDELRGRGRRPGPPPVQLPVLAEEKRHRRKEGVEVWAMAAALRCSPFVSRERSALP